VYDTHFFFCSEGSGMGEREGEKVAGVCVHNVCSGWFFLALLTSWMRLFAATPIRMSVCEGVLETWMWAEVLWFILSFCSVVEFEIFFSSSELLSE
jgi:hypothetical protein